jgi:ABC-2 type transport system permease protein
MKPWLADLQLIARSEWCAWQRSRLARAGAALFTLLLLATTVLTSLRIQTERTERLQNQARAEAAFLAQPDRHPHRMVHYGHYVFRTPAPLAVFDPGLDPVTGLAIFLEGHRQNTAMFADGGASADLGSMSWLSPATVYQHFLPLLLILLGHGMLTREREAGTLAALLAQGVPSGRLLAGKLLALVGCVVLLALPLVLSGAVAMALGEHFAAVLALLGAYLLYLFAWAALALLASALFQRRAAAIASLAAVWIALNLVLPAVAASSAASNEPAPGKLETELAMLEDLRKVGDGHNANDPAFAQLRADLLARHKVARVEDLPVNLRGLVAQYSESRLTDTLNAYAQRQMAAETAQAERLARLGWFTPALALAETSRALVGTDLWHHHRFLREAEALRYDFVQRLNRVHTEQLAYVDDIKRSSDTQAERRTRVSATNWQVLERFSFVPDAAAHRIARAGPSVLMLLIWCGALGLALGWAARRLRP